MKLFGHPVHVMLIHFPAALLPMDFVCSSIAYYSNDPTFVSAAVYALTGGVVTGWLAIVFGVADLLKLVKTGSVALKTALFHGAINTVVIAGFTVVVLVKLGQLPVPSVDSIWLLALKMMLLTFMIVGNYLGGRLIFTYRVAVENGEHHEI